MEITSEKRLPEKAIPPSFKVHTYVQKTSIEGQACRKNVEGHFFFIDEARFFARNVETPGYTRLDRPLPEVRQEKYLKLTRAGR